MKRIAILAGLALLVLAAAAGAENPLVFDLPMMLSPPTLDGVRGADEWAGALELECSPSQILRDGAEFGWRDIETQQSEVSVNQLVQADDESAAIARTDDDYSSMIWQAWDADALYFLIEARDNIHDVVGAGVETNWWERDSMCLYVDLVNSREEWGGSGYVYERARLNLINFVAMPQQSSSVSITWERLIQDERTPTQDPAEIEGLEYGYRDAIDEFGGEADYVIEGKVPWETLLKYNLPAVPSVGSEMGFVWLAADPDNSEAYGGQIQCYGWADNPVDYSTWIFTDTPAGREGDGTAVETDSWGNIKATFH
jgi:hypothetical protein